MALSHSTVSVEIIPVPGRKGLHGKVGCTALFAEMEQHSFLSYGPTSPVKVSIAAWK